MSVSAETSSRAADMNTRSRAAAISAMLAACAVVMLVLSSVVPTGRMALAALAGVCMVPVVLRCGAAYAAASFAVSGVLALLLCPVKLCAAVYVLFFGWYPIVKSCLERIKSRAAEWVLKLICFNAAALCLYVVCTKLTLVELTLPELSIWSAACVCAATNAVFVLYDIALTRVIFLYLNKFIKK